MRYILNKHKITADTKVELTIKVRNLEGKEESIVGTIVESTIKMINVLFVIGKTCEGKPIHRSLGENTRIVNFKLLN